MWPYWAMFATTVFGMWSEAGSSPQGKQGLRPDNGRWIIAGIALTLLIGFRFKVGGDWGAYQRIYESTNVEDIQSLLVMKEPGYVLLNLVAISLDWGIFGVNLMSGGIFAYGLVEFCRSHSRPWLALMTAVPYLLIVVAMGYTRQGIAIGIIMLGITALMKGRIFIYILAVVLAAGFHRSAIVMVPIGLMAGSRSSLGFGTSLIASFCSAQRWISILMSGFSGASSHSCRSRFFSCCLCTRRPAPRLTGWHCISSRCSWRFSVGCRLRTAFIRLAHSKARALGVVTAKCF
jgi:hypothetical protein